MIVNQSEVIGGVVCVWLLLQCAILSLTVSVYF